MTNRTAQPYATVTKVFNFDVCRVSVNIVGHSSATSGYNGCAPTWVKDWSDDSNDLNPAQPGILLFSSSSFSVESADAIIQPRVVSS